MGQVRRYFVGGFAGAAAGSLCLTVVAHLEEWQFYTVRALVTGRSAMSQIVAHPADRWVVLAHFGVFILGGAIVGMLAANWFPSKAKRSTA